MRHPIIVLPCLSDHSLTHRRPFYFVKILLTVAMWIMPASNQHRKASYNVPSLATWDYPPGGTYMLVLSPETFTSSRLSTLTLDIPRSRDTTQGTIHTYNIFEFWRPSYPNVAISETNSKLHVQGFLSSPRRNKRTLSVLQ